MSINLNKFSNKATYVIFCTICRSEEVLNESLYSKGSFDPLRRLGAFTERLEFERYLR